MGESNQNSVLSALVDLSKVDGRIAILKAVLNEVEAQRTKRAKAFETLHAEKKRREDKLTEKKALSDKEDKAVKHERERINERRAALNSLNDYKIQQAATREIDFVSKQIGQREELLLELFREVEALEKQVEEVNEIVRGAEAEQASFDKKLAARVQEAESELETLSSERAAKTQHIEDKETLVIYDRLVSRFPSDPIVEVVNQESCAACFMKLGPQVPVQIARGDVVKCPGCGRLLRLSDDN
jgi:predicted  nucleic acid-binding Zn-ribbon protein